MYKTVQLNVTVFVDASKPLVEMANVIDTALASIEPGVVDDWSIENESGQTYEWDSYEQAGKFGE